MSLTQSDPAYQEAMHAYLAGDWSAAEKAFSGLVQKHPDDAFLKLLLGNIHYSQGNLDQAIKFYTEATESKPDLGIGFYKLGICYYRTGFLQKALDNFSKVVEQKSQSHAMASYFVGLINFFLGRDDEAEKGFALLREQSSESRIANYYMAQIKIKQKKYDQALPLLEELVAGNPQFAEVYYMLGVTQYGLHNNTEAIRNFRTALEINPQDERSRTKLALLTDVQWP